MSENTERPVAVWRERGDNLHTMECGNCGADAHYQIVDGVWRYEPYCAHCGARVYKQEDLPMSENKKPRLAEVLGVEVGEKFRIADYPVDYGDVAVCTDGKVRRVRSNPPLEHGDKIGANALYHIINHPELIKRGPRWTEQEVEDANNIIRMFGEDNFTYVTKDENGWPILSDGYEDCATFTVGLEKIIFPSLKPGQTVKLDDIIGGNE